MQTNFFLVCTCSLSIQNKLINFEPHIDQPICNRYCLTKLPCFFQGVFSKKSFALSKCFLPEESTVIVIYILAGVLLVVVNVSVVFFLMKNQWKFRLRPRGPSKRHEMKSL